MRVIALGASNLTRGLPALVSISRGAWGQDVEVVAALGLGRSYGAESRILARTLPGILHCGIWRRLDEAAADSARALVTDVGNDILYGFAPGEILGWVEECVARLLRHTRDVVIADLPLESIRRQPSAKFMAFRTVLVPRCRLSRATILDRAEQISAGLASLAAGRGLRFVRLRPEWYGFDPVHFRPGQWRAAWREILLGGDHVGGAEVTHLGEALHLFGLAPERQKLFGVERVRPQSGVALRAGGRVYLY